MQVNQLWQLRMRCNVLAGVQAYSAAFSFGVLFPIVLVQIRYVCILAIASTISSIPRLE